MNKYCTTISLHDCQLEAKIGALTFEQHLSQTLLLNLCVGFDATQAMSSDKLDDTVDYAKILACCQALALDKHYQLIEHLGHCLATTVLAEFPSISSLKLQITKPHILPGTKGVSFTLETSRQDAST